jgi:mRNA-degrading endonuclease RelE of RelBE toxin-antitoxin system
MGLYSVEIISKAEKECLRLSESVKNRFQEIILALEKDPRPFGSKNLEKPIITESAAVTTE